MNVWPRHIAVIWFFHWALQMLLSTDERMTKACAHRCYTIEHYICYCATDERMTKAYRCHIIEHYRGYCLQMNVWPRHITVISLSTTDVIVYRWTYDQGISLSYHWALQRLLSTDERMTKAYRCHIIEHYRGYCLQMNVWPRHIAVISLSTTEVIVYRWTYDQGMRTSLSYHWALQRLLCTDERMTKAYRCYIIEHYRGYCLQMNVWPRHIAVISLSTTDVIVYRWTYDQGMRTSLSYHWALQRLLSTDERMTKAHRCHIIEHYRGYCLQMNVWPRHAHIAVISLSTTYVIVYRWAYRCHIIEHYICYCVQMSISLSYHWALHMLLCTDEHIAVISLSTTDVIVYRWTYGQGISLSYHWALQMLLSTDERMTKAYRCHIIEHYRCYCLQMNVRPRHIAVISLSTTDVIVYRWTYDQGTSLSYHWALQMLLSTDERTTKACAHRCHIIEHYRCYCVQMNVCSDEFKLLHYTDPILPLFSNVCCCNIVFW